MGFLSDVRRMNVALTRARRSLWIIGHSQTLSGCQPWQVRGLGGLGVRMSGANVHAHTPHVAV